MRILVPKNPIFVNKKILLCPEKPSVYSKICSFSSRPSSCDRILSTLTNPPDPSTSPFRVEMLFSTPSFKSSYISLPSPNLNSIIGSYQSSKSSPDFVRFLPSTMVNPLPATL
ncbi:hypothetical protein CDAR_124561 [Caerostris darwini]|uniref:Uncharacterized protein n=1 Tax=Caerostris darwini TaxID=1538125 RepID=A0AAV4RJP4_9ARAC|nr:hypothetical protein CDAR_124561 [Caerostris darwini]